MNGKLFLTRHGESEWNKLGKWTGQHDCGLSELGKEQAGKLGAILKNEKIDIVFTSAQRRAKETYDGMKTSAPNLDASTFSSPEINERDYGDFTGKNKWEVQKEVGDEEFLRIRRSWDYPIPNGESLKQVYARSVPFYISEIAPLLKKGKNVLVVAHGNSIRSIVKFLEDISDEKISEVEMHFGQVLVYEIGEDYKSVKKIILKI